MAQILKTLNVPGVGKSLNTWFEQVAEAAPSGPGVTEISLVVLEAIRNELLLANVTHIHGITALSTMPGVIDANIVGVQGATALSGITGAIDASIIGVQGIGVTSVEDFQGTGSEGTTGGVTGATDDDVELKIQKLYYPVSE